MKSLKRILTLILIASMFIGLIACQSKDEPGSSGKDSDVTDDSKKDDEKKDDENKEDENKEDDEEKDDDLIAKFRPIEGKKYEISWIAANNAIVEEDAELVKYFNEEFNVDIDVWGIDSAQWDEVLNLKFASQEIPDKLQIRGFVNLQKYYDQDFMTDLPEEVLKELAPNIYNTLEEEAPGIIKYGKIDGVLYGIPGYNTEARFRKPVIWRGDWLKNVGIEKIPETLEEFEEAFYKFVKEDPNKSGKADTYALSAGLDGIYGAFGYIPTHWAERDGKLVFGGVQPEMKDALALLSKWYKDGIIDPEFITGENKGGYWALSHAFLDGKIGYTNHADYYHWKEKVDEKDTGIVGHNIQELEKMNPEVIDELVFGQPPVGPNGDQKISQGNLVTGIFEGFGKQLEDEPDKIGKILEIYNYTVDTFENYVLGRQGFEGKQWEFVNDIPTRIDIYTDAKELAKMGAMSNFNIIQPYKYTSKLSPYNASWATEHGFDQNGTSNELLTTLPSQGKYKAELDKIYEETYISIIVGDKPIDYFDEFVETWNSAGGEILTKEANEWYSSIQD